ncbi:scaffolding protein [Streptomyces phage Success]|uniref:Scaffolding protein n=1 Tax=Streptomyces phage Success TaxID=2999013 RepID=A0A9E8M794_9CAUD|nr:scaffolding protein [Streptomyces phage Success]WAB08831.1 scaffolding protein [Streptomyces phage Success]
MDDTKQNENNQQAPAGTEPPKAPTVEELQADVERWKTLSRQNEKNYNEARTELSKLQEASMTDAEKAIEKAKEEARNAALSEVGSRLVEAELRVQAATAGVTLPPAEFLNVQRFIGADGSPDTAAIQTFVSSLPQPSKAPEFAQGIGLGRQGDSGGYAAGQIGRDALSRMSPQEIAAARKKGQLDALMRGDL